MSTRAIVEKEIPLLPAGAEAPGGWVASTEGGSSTWKGESSWRTAHGAAEVSWLLGRPLRVKAALDGSERAEVETFTHDRTLFRRAAGDGYVHGRIEISDDDVIFTRVTMEAYRPVPETDAPSLEVDLAGDSAFLARVSDAGFAHALYETLCNREFRKAGSDGRWSCTWRYAGGMIADLRGKGEGYLDFYLAEPRDSQGVALGGRLPGLMAEVEAEFLRLGWHELTEEEAAVDRLAAIPLIKAIEARPAGTRPDWTRLMGDAAGTEPLDRLRRAALDGKVSHAEWRRLTDMLVG